jgi:threonine dehydrogenase-like Zn-dependent dehydrogenase
MKVAAITGKRQAALVEKPMPQIKDDFVLVKIEVAPMCTEYKGYKEGWVSDSLGHEAAGVVVDVAQPGKVKIGDRVVVMPQYPCGKCHLCMTGDYIHCEHTVDPLTTCGSESGTATYAQYCIKQDWLLVPVPDEMSLTHASMTCCGLGPTFEAARRMNVGAGDTLLVTGLGPVGLGAVINGVYRGAKVIGVDSELYRAKLALELGAKVVIDPNDEDALERVKGLTGGRGVDMAVDCTAVPAAQKFAIEATRRRGQVAFVGWGGNIKIDNMVPQGLTLHGIWHWNLGAMHPFLKMIGDVGELIDQQITHTFPMSRVQEAWELQLTGNCGKVLLNPWA